jgi:hypothetical protein
VTAQRSKLRIAKSGIGAFDIATMPEAHEFHLIINTRGGTDLGHPVAKVVLVPGEMDLSAPINLITNDKQSTVLRQSLETFH